MDKEQYIENEISRFNSNLNSLEKQTLQDRKHARESLTNDLTKNDGIRFFRAVDFVLNGDFGAGAYYAIERMIKNPRINHKAALFNWTAALEFLSPIRVSCEVWNNLTENEKEFFNKQLQQRIDDYKLKEKSCN